MVVNNALILCLKHRIESADIAFLVRKISFVFLSRVLCALFVRRVGCQSCISADLISCSQQHYHMPITCFKCHHVLNNSTCLSHAIGNLDPHMFSILTRPLHGYHKHIACFPQACQHLSYVRHMPITCTSHVHINTAYTHTGPGCLLTGQCVDTPHARIHCLQEVRICDQGTVM